MTNDIDDKFYLRLKYEYLSSKESAKSTDRHSRHSSSQKSDKSEAKKVSKFEDSYTLLGIDKNKIRRSCVSNNFKKQKTKKGNKIYDWFKESIAYKELFNDHAKQSEKDENVSYNVICKSLFYRYFDFSFVCSKYFSNL